MAFLTHASFKAALYRPLSFDSYCSQHQLQVVGHHLLLPKVYLSQFETFLGQREEGEEAEEEGGGGAAAAAPVALVPRTFSRKDWHLLQTCLGEGIDFDLVTEAKRLGREAVEWEQNCERKRLAASLGLHVPNNQALTISNFTLQKVGNYTMETRTTSKTILLGLFAKRCLWGDGSRTVPCP